MADERKRGQSDDSSRGSIVRNGSEGDEVLGKPNDGSLDDITEEVDQSGTRGERGKPDASH